MQQAGFYLSLGRRGKKDEKQEETAFFLFPFFEIFGIEDDHV